MLQLSGRNFHLNSVTVEKERIDFGGQLTFSAPVPRALIFVSSYCSFNVTVFLYSSPLSSMGNTFQDPR